MKRYICEDELHPRAIQAGLSTGTLKVFARDADLRQWYKVVPSAPRNIDPERIEYVCESDLSEVEVRDGVAAGILQFWRVDPEGRHWFVCEEGARDELASIVGEDDD
jgi:hypothetical protein